LRDVTWFISSEPWHWFAITGGFSSLCLQTFDSISSSRVADTASEPRYNAHMNSSHSPQSDVCVVGDGAIAKTAALGLAQQGHRVTLLCPPKAAPAASPATVSPSWDVRVFALNRTAHTLLASLKVWGALDASRVARVDSMVVNGDGAQAGGLSFDAYGAHLGELAWIVENRNLNQALDAALNFAHNVAIVHGRAIRLDTAGAAATLYLEGGDHITASLLVGADGKHSWVRGQCDIGLDYRPYGQRGVVANFACEKPHHGAAHQWFTGADGIVALLPLPGNKVSLVWSAPDTLADTLRGETAAELAVRVSAFCKAQLGELTPLEPEAVADFPLALMRPHSMVAPRVALVGDAAHTVHPLAGHGMNLGFGDIADLLKVIAAREPERDIGDERVLARYARARKEDVLLMQVATDGLARLFATNIEPLRVARNLGLNLLDKFPVLKRRLISHAAGK
jgi:2-octaprenylphenol hydroxylase